MTISGTVSTLLFGFGAFLIDKLHSSEFVSIIGFLLLVAVAGNVAAIFLSARSFRLQQYRFAIVYDSFYKKGEINEDEINDYKKMPKEEFNDTMIWAYLRCIKVNFENNNRKINWITSSQWCVVVGTVLIPIVIGVVMIDLL
jgi:hypothetical protein